MRHQPIRFTIQPITGILLSASVIFLVACGYHCCPPPIDATPFVGEAALAHRAPIQVGKGRRFVCTDYSGKKVFLVQPDGSAEWIADAPNSNDIWALPNGNTVLTNWVGHGHIGKAPHIIEVTRDKKIVWLFQDHETMKTISSIQVLDVPGDPLKGEVIH